MSKVIIVPDIHGRDFWRVLKNIEIPRDTQVVFLGDYLDPYPHEFAEKGEALFRRVFDNAQALFAWGKGKRNVHFLLGNHDAQYLAEFPQSRYDYFHSDEIRDLLNNCGVRFNITHHIGEVLFSHAPLTIQFLDEIGKTKDELNAMAGSTVGLAMLVSYCSEYRGGTDKYASPLWVDICELAENPALKLAMRFSVCGHTQLADTGEKGIIEERDFWCACIDSRAVFEMDTEDPTNTLKVLDLSAGQ